MSQPEFSRRDFLKKGGAGAAGLIWLLHQSDSAQAAAEPAGDEAVGMLIDLTRCTGCDACALACRDYNGRPYTSEKPRTLNSGTYTCIEERQMTGPAGEPQSQYVKRQCMHCLKPACVSACTVGALRKTAEGPVVYEADKCIGCRYCQYACPFGVPAYDWDNALGLIHKCQMCVTRLAEGQPPACVEACPNGALRFGKRKELLAQARAQIASNPGRYVDHIYGEHEVGGASVLYMAGLPFSELGFPQLGSEPIPEEAELMMKRTPAIALTVASLASALYWLTRRREKASEMAVDQAAGEGDKL
jgi:formate dehydrogenase iron-sulfur subunit